jgi:hypothetical protein
MSARQKSPARTPSKYHASPSPSRRPYPARKPCVADRQRARKRSDATLGLVAHQGATGVQSSRKGYRFVHERNGRVHPPVFTLRPIRRGDKDAWWFCRRESGRPILMPHGTGSSRYGGSVSATRTAATSSLKASGSVPRHAARARRCSPALMRGPRGSPCLARLGPITIPGQDPK